MEFHPSRIIYNYFRYNSGYPFGFLGNGWLRLAYEHLSTGVTYAHDQGRGCASVF
jgi:hypothetical protein